PHHSPGGRGREPVHRRDIHQSRARRARRLGRGSRQPLLSADTRRGAGYARTRTAPLLRARGVRSRGDAVRGPLGRRARRGRGAAYPVDRRPVRRQDAGERKLMNSTFAEAPGGTSAAAAPPAATGLGVTLLTLVRREFWEHRALWIAPLCLTALLAVVAAIGQ